MSDAAPAPSGGFIPFWVHQVVEMLLGLLLLFEGARTGAHAAVLIGLGSALLLLSLCSDGALGAWPWIGRRVHRVMDFGFAAVFAAAPLILGLHQILSIVIIEAAALALVWLAIRTNWTARSRESRATASTAPATPTQPLPASTRAHQLGVTMGQLKDEGPHRLGRLVGRARARAKRPPETS